MQIKVGLMHRVGPDGTSHANVPTPACDDSWEEKRLKIKISLWSLVVLKLLFCQPNCFTFNKTFAVLSHYSTCCEYAMHFAFYAGISIMIINYITKHPYKLEKPSLFCLVGCLVISRMIPPHLPGNCDTAWKSNGLKVYTNIAEQRKNILPILLNPTCT